MKISDHLIQSTTDDNNQNILNKEAYEVNMRLFREDNSDYKKVILEIIKYMDKHLRSSFEDYPDPKGIAAPNLGFPLKIIGYKKEKNENQFCLNPKIVFTSANKVVTQSNCGCLRLPAVINVERYAIIDLEYYDLTGNLTRKHSIPRNEGGFTIQNAVDQCNGLTILDRQTKNPS